MCIVQQAKCRFFNAPSQYNQIQTHYDIWLNRIIHILVRSDTILLHKPIPKKKQRTTTTKASDVTSLNFRILYFRAKNQKPKKKEKRKTGNGVVKTVLDAKLRNISSYWFEIFHNSSPIPPPSFLSSSPLSRWPILLLFFVFLFFLFFLFSFHYFIIWYFPSPSLLFTTL